MSGRSIVSGGTAEHPGAWTAFPERGPQARRLRRLRRLRILVVGVTLVLAALVSAASASANTIFSDGFEAADFFQVWNVQTAVDGKAGPQSTIVKSGTVAAQLSESSTAGSKAYARKTFSAPSLDLTATGDFNLQQQGASGGNVPFFRFIDPTGVRLVSVYRQNVTTGNNIGVLAGSSRFTATAKLALNTWANVAMHVVINGANSTVEVRLNGSLVLPSTTVNLGTNGVSTIQIGNDTAAQTFNIVADNISADSADTSTSSPPANTVAPVISGTAQQGATLTTDNGTWTSSAPITSYTYQWRRCDSSGTTCSDIAGATGQSYVASSADVGTTLKVAVTATNSAGSSTAVSAATGVVQSASVAPSNTALPTITGTAQDGQTLTATPGDWNGTQPMTFAYRWERCDTSGAGCTPVSGAASATYVVSATDVGSTLRVAVTATNSVGSAIATSAPTAVVQASQTAPGLVALWHMDETSGTVMHDSVGSHDGTLHSVQLGVDLGFPGTAGTAFGFNGSSSYVSVPSASDLNPSANPITVTIRLKSTSVPATPDWDLIRKGLYTTSGGEFKMEYQPSGQASCGFKGSGGYSELMAGPAINDGQWHTVQCVKTSTAIKVVVDGVAFSKAANIGSTANTDAVPIGARPGSEFFKGSLDEASIQMG